MPASSSTAASSGTRSKRPGSATSAEAVADQRNEQLARRELQAAAKGRPLATPLQRVEPKVVGGSTISQQLAKNLFLLGERTAPRKAQEFVITFMLEGLLPKQRILRST